MNWNDALDHPCTITLKTPTAFKVQIDDYTEGVSWIGVGKC